MIKFGQILLKGVIRVHNGEIRLFGLERSQLGMQYKELRSYGLERSEFGTEYKNDIKWSWKESIR